MTDYADFASFTDEFGERRRRAALITPPLLRALGLIARNGAGGMALAPVHATSDLLTDTLGDLGRAEEELRVQNEALFAAHTELAHAQQLFHDLFEFAPTAALVTAADGRILRLNAAALALLARPANALVGKPLAAYVALADRAAFRTALARSAASPRVETWPVRFVPAHGDPVECRVHTRALHVPAELRAGLGTPLAASDSADSLPDAALYPGLQWAVTEDPWHSADDIV